MVYMAHATRNNSRISTEYYAIPQEEKLSVEDWARALRISPVALESEVDYYEIHLAPDMAYELARIFGASPDNWL